MLHSRTRCLGAGKVSVCDLKILLYVPETTDPNSVSPSSVIMKLRISCSVRSILLRIITQRHAAYLIIFRHFLLHQGTDFVVDHNAD